MYVKQLMVAAFSLQINRIEIFELYQSVFENSFLLSAWPCLRHICPNLGYIARYVPFIQDRAATNWDAQLSESIFKTEFTPQSVYKLIDF